jgi:hypothetical protein
VRREKAPFAAASSSPLTAASSSPLTALFSSPQLREEFDQGLDVPLDEEQNVHEVAALLKEFLRDLPHPLLTRELYAAFINSMCEQNARPTHRLHHPPPPCIRFVF